MKSLLLLVPILLVGCDELNSDNTISQEKMPSLFETVAIKVVTNSNHRFVIVSTQHGSCSICEVTSQSLVEEK